MISPENRAYRFVVLLFTCLVTFGSYFCFDMPSVLQDKFQQNGSCPSQNITDPNDTVPVPPRDNCCTDCLGMSPEDYNLLYAMYAWTNAVVVLGAGFFVDKLGNMVGLMLFSFVCLLGASCVALGAMFPGSHAMLPLMLVGRLIFGAGNGSLTVVQYRVVSYWFRNKELAMAFGSVLAVSRLGSVLNFLLTANFAARYGIVWTLWGGATLCCIGFLSSTATSLLDRHGTRHLRQDADLKIQSKLLKLSDIRHFEARYWLLNLTLVLYYSGVLPFVADANKFISDKYGYKQTAPYIAGAIYDVSLVLAPVLGYLVDRIGKRGWILFACSLVNLPIFIILTFTKIHPLICTISLGLTYSFMATSLWPSVPILVSQATVGTATGITSSLQMVGVGLSNVVVGQILGSQDDISKEESLRRWKYVMAFLLCNIAVCVAASWVLIVMDKRRGGLLNKSKRELTTQTVVEDSQSRGEERRDSEGEGDDLSQGDDDTQTLVPDLHHRGRHVQFSGTRDYSTSPQHST